MYLTKFTGWEECSALTYANCYNLFGGNFSSNPATLAYIHDKTDFDYKYLRHIGKNKKIDGAICIWDNKYIANGSVGLLSKKQPALPIAEDELLVPLSDNFTGFLPFKAKILSPLQTGKILNATFSLNAGRTISLCKGTENFSKKTQATMNRKLKKFIAAGGGIIDNKNFNPQQLAEIYAELYYIRRHEKVCLQTITEFIVNFRENIFGKLFFMNEVPCAFMLNIKFASTKYLFIDFINIVRNEKFDNLSLGTIAMWQTIIDAEALISSPEQQLRFSFGRPTAEYKKQFCVNQAVGRIITF